MTSSPVTAVSAPGKVLLNGGYLVVDRAHTGLVFGLNARIHAHVQDIPTPEGVSLSEIVVQSPQFRFSEWRYGYRLAEGDGGVAVVQLTGYSTSIQPRNPFIETALLYILTYISSTTSFSTLRPITITILASTSYYSHASTATPCPSNPSSPFLDFAIPLSSAHKTGLGSSAALVSSITSALLCHFLPTSNFDLNERSGQLIAHNLAQAAHCAAQGKVGSGFDVAAAIFGSCVYRRFSPSVLEHAGEAGRQGFGSRLATLVNDDAKVWDTQIQSDVVKMPKGLKLLMCDVDCGSETPSMVKKVFAWRKEKPEEAETVWKALQKRNEEFVAVLNEAAEKGLDQEKKGALRNLILECRKLIREMSEKSGVPVEPPVQTELLDACSEVEGVIGGVVPGAGGFDALALLVEDGHEVRARLEAFLKDYKPRETGGDVKIGRVSLLDVEQEMQGARKEDHDLYRGWV